MATATVIRKHLTDRQWQLWDTTTSFQDPPTTPAAAKGARMLWESHWWSIPEDADGGLAIPGHRPHRRHR
jgi:hypothetical protein